MQEVNEGELARGPGEESATVSRGKMTQGEATARAKGLRWERGGRNTRGWGATQCALRGGWGLVLILYQNLSLYLVVLRRNKPKE